MCDSNRNQATERSRIAGPFPELSKLDSTSRPTEPELQAAEHALWHERLESEVNNFRAAIDWTREVDRGELEVRFASSPSLYTLRVFTRSA